MNADGPGSVALVLSHMSLYTKKKLHEQQQQRKKKEYSPAPGAQTDIF